MNDLIQRIMKSKHKTIDFPRITSGDTVEVHVKVKEGEKERIQKFKGVITKIQGSGSSRAFTVRKIASGVGVERTFPFFSPNIAQIDLLAKGKVRQSRLFYLRELRGKAARIKSELITASSKNS